jgi:LacI family transcriptional regulator, gluconate utilization system Gnt-I transcriptional repressor
VGIRTDKASTLGYDARNHPAKDTMKDKKPKQSRNPQKAHKKAPTLIDVAKVAGVSPISVSRTLNQPELVSEEIQQKVRDAITRTGYVPNMLAGSLATRSSRLVALIVPTIANSIFADTVQAITDTLAQAGYQTLLGLSAYDKHQEEELLKAILGNRPDGIILTGTFHAEGTHQRLLNTRIPVVETWDLTPNPIDTLVGFSHTEVGKAVGEYLLAKGYRRFASVSANDQRAVRRFAGFAAALRDAGIEHLASRTVPTPARFRQGRENLAALLDSGEVFDAVYCSSDTLAHGVIAEALHRNIRIPDDLAVIGFGNLDFSAYTYPAITTVGIKGAEIGRLAAEALIAKMDESTPPDGSSPRIIDVGFNILEREST